MRGRAYPDVGLRLVSGIPGGDRNRPRVGDMAIGAGTPSKLLVEKLESREALIEKVQCINM